MEYKNLSVEGQRQVLDGRITGWEAEHCGHANDAARYEAMLARDLSQVDRSAYTDAIDLARRSMVLLEVSIETAIEAREGLE